MGRQTASSGACSTQHTVLHSVIVLSKLPQSRPPGRQQREGGATCKCPKADAAARRAGCSSNSPNIRQHSRMLCLCCTWECCCCAAQGNAQPLLTPTLRWCVQQLCALTNKVIIRASLSIRTQSFAGCAPSPSNSSTDQLGARQHIWAGRRSLGQQYCCQCGSPNSAVQLSMRAAEIIIIPMMGAATKGALRHSALMSRCGTRHAQSSSGRPTAQWGTNFGHLYHTCVHILDEREEKTLSRHVHIHQGRKKLQSSLTVCLHPDNPHRRRMGDSRIPQMLPLPSML